MPTPIKILGVEIGVGEFNAEFDSVTCWEAVTLNALGRKLAALQEAAELPWFTLSIASGEIQYSRGMGYEDVLIEKPNWALLWVQPGAENLL